MTPCRKVLPLAVACLSFIFVSCEKEYEWTGSAVHTQEIMLTRTENSVRSTYDEFSGILRWEEGDTVYAYTFNDASGTVPAPEAYPIVRESAADAVVELSYDAGHDRAVFISKGSKVGGISANDRRYVTITGGIPAVQDGKLESSFVNISDKLILQSQDRMALESLQAFIAFSMDSTVLGGKSVKEVIIQGGLGTETLAGDARYDLTGASEATVVSNAKAEIKFESTLSFEKQKLYYVAINPGTYENGLKFIVRDADDVAVAWITTRANTRVEAGRVTYIGNLCGHKTVPARADSLVMHPSDIHIANLPEYCLTKKLYVDFFPLDMDGVTWESDNPAVATVAAGPKEYYNGHWCWTATVTPVWSSDDPKAEATCTITCKDIVSEEKCTCSVTVGYAVDMGFSDVYFLASNVVGSQKDGSLTLAAAPGIGGSYYHWGFVDEAVPGTWNWSGGSRREEYDDNRYDEARGWTGDDRGVFRIDPGESPETRRIFRRTGKYSEADRISVLDATDDPCEVINPGKWRMPMYSEAVEFRNNTSIIDGIVRNGEVCRIVKSKVKYFEDVHLVFSLMGYCKNIGECFYVGRIAMNMLKECNESMIYGHFFSSTDVRKGGSATFHADSPCYCYPYSVALTLFDEYEASVYRLEAAPIRGVQIK